MKNCDHCQNTYWVCRDHPAIPFGDGNGCCGGYGMLCPECFISVYCKKCGKHISDELKKDISENKTFKALCDDCFKKSMG